MDILKIVLYIIFVIDCIALSAIILLQEGKSAGLGTIGGMADTYWGQNKGRSMEGALVKSTKFLAILFLVLAVDFTDKVYDAYVSPKKGKIDSAVQTDLNFFMIYYVFPAILLTEHDDAKLIADHLCSRWGEKFKNSKIQYTDYDSLYVSFREKIFGIF